MVAWITPQRHAEQCIASYDRSFYRQKRQNLVDLAEKSADISGYRRIDFLTAPKK